MTEDLHARAERHLPLVRALMGRVPHRAQDGEELFQTGCVGLMKALHGFDPSRGTAFSTYAVPVILGEMRQYLRKSALIPLPRSELDLRRSIRQAQTALVSRLHREPSIQELADAVGLSPTELTLHLESPAAVDIALVPAPIDLERQVELRDILRRLPPGDQRIILLRQRMGLTQAETGRRLGMSQMQVSRREQIIRTMLRHAVGSPS